MKIIKESIRTVIIGFVLIAGVSMVYAWTGPTEAPPGGNVSAPINVGPTDGTGTQYKYNALGIGGLFQTYADTYLATDSGNVGIGTTSPNYKLDVVGRARLQAGNDVSAGFWLRDVADTSNASFIGRASDVNEFTGIWGNKSGNTGWKFIVKDDGNVGIGTDNPGAKLEVSGNIIADTPINDNHVATKGYVDAQSSGVTWAGYTGETTGAFGAIRGANAKCESAFPGSHWASMDEIARLGNSYPWAKSVWIRDGLAGGGGDIVDGWVYAKDGERLSINSQNYLANCRSWTYGEKYLAGYPMSGVALSSIGSGVFSSCGSSSVSLACVY